jgi:hypothetical protein
MKMRDYYDAKHGPGAWDKLHEAINEGRFDWVQPEILLDNGSKARIFPGTNPEITYEEVKAEIERVLKKVFHEISGD